MIGWHDGYNWTYEQFIGTVIMSLEIDGDEYVSLDVEHSDRKNIDDIIRWAEEKGYQAEEASGGDVIKIWK